MVSKYDIFCKVVELGSFTKAANELGYTQSAVSQNIMSLEKECRTALIHRSKEGVSLTKDGAQLYPYILAIRNAELAYERKRAEMLGLENTSIHIGAFTSVSRQILPPIMASFKEMYPSVEFVVEQGDYTSIPKWLLSGEIDIGFVEDSYVRGLPLTVAPFFQNDLVAVLPKDHPLADRESISVRELAEDSFILMDDGSRNITTELFSSVGVVPRINYKIYDDYTIIAMIRQGLGISFIFKTVLDGFEDKVAVVPLQEESTFNIGIACRDRAGLSYAALKFMDYLVAHRPASDENRP